MFKLEEKSDHSKYANKLIDSDSLADFECQTADGHKPGTDFWCIVSVTRNEHNDISTLVLKYSEDAAYCCLFEEVYADDCGMDSSWFKDDMSEGVYHLKVVPYSSPPSYPDGDWDCEINVAKNGVTLMLRF